MKKVKIIFEIEMTDDYFNSDNMQTIITEVNSGQTAKEMMETNEYLGFLGVDARIELI